MRVSVTHTDVVIRKGWVGRETRYQVEAFIEFTDEEKEIVRRFSIGRHVAYKADKEIEFPHFEFTINDLLYTRPHLRVFPNAAQARMFERELVEKILPYVKSYMTSTAGPRDPQSYEI